MATAWPRTVLSMGVTGLIFGAVAAIWLAYLVPWYLSHRDHRLSDENDPTVQFARGVKLLHTCEEPDDTLDADVSTPLMRFARRRDLGMKARRAARTRRRVLLLCLATFVGLTVAAVVRVLPWWAAFVGLAILVSWLLVSRFTTVRMYRQLDERLAELRLGDEEPTVVIRLDDSLLVPALSAGEENEHSILLDEPVVGGGLSLWDPIPVPAQTYLSRPLAPRTVRTIDLSAPHLPAPAEPVTAESNDTASGSVQRAVGE